MRPNVILSVVVILGTISALGYGVLRTQPTQAEVDAQLNTLTPPLEKKAMNVRILNESIVTEIESWKSFGTLPIAPKDLQRNNPFEGV